MIIMMTYLLSPDALLGTMRIGKMRPSGHLAYGKSTHLNLQEDGVVLVDNDHNFSLVIV